MKTLKKTLAFASALLTSAVLAVTCSPAYSWAESSETALSDGAILVEPPSKISFSDVTKSYRTLYDAYNENGSCMVSDDECLIILNVPLNRSGCVIEAWNCDYSYSGTADIEVIKTGTVYSGGQYEDVEALNYYHIKATSAGRLHITASLQENPSFFFNLTIDDKLNFSDSISYDKPIDYIKYPESFSEFNELLQEYPERYRIDSDSVYFMRDVDYIVSTVSEFTSERNDYGYVFKPLETGVYVISAYETCEEIINLDETSGKSGHLHFFYPHIYNYTVTVTNEEIIVEKDGERNFRDLADIDSEIKNLEINPDIEIIMGDYAPIEFSDVINTSYYSYVNSHFLDNCYFTYIDYLYGSDTSQFCINTSYSETDNLYVSDTTIAEITMRGHTSSYVDGDLMFGTDDIMNFYVISPLQDGKVDVHVSDANNQMSTVLTIFNGQFVSSSVEWSHIIGDSGDLNGDGEITIADAVLLKNYIYCGASLTTNQLYAADLNNDNEIDCFDIVFIRRKLISTSTH